MAFSGELKGISKSYGSCHANQDVDLFVRAGTIHALIGENGAGKSTAMKMLFGAVRPDRGVIKFGGETVFENGGDWRAEKAFKRGIGMVYQHFMLAGPETVHDNLVLGAEATRLGLRDRKAEHARLEALMRDTGLNVPLDRTVDELPIGLKSRCEILKVLYRNARFLVLDEPTSVLTPQEIGDFLNVLKRLRDQGNTILIVTHKLKEIMAIADEATILRQGKTVATRKIAETSIAELSELMIGRRLQLPRASRLSDAAKAQVKAKLCFGNSKLELRAGEITGIAGVEGNGQEKIAHALIEPASVASNDKSFSLEIFGKDARKSTAVEMRKLPIAIIPADRHHEGLVLSFDLVENLRLGRKQATAKGFFSGVTREESELLKEYDVRPNIPSIEARGLSGGNQQKLIVARELGDLAAESIVLAVHPTRGVDLGAIEFIHSKILEAAAAGAAVLLISSELDELMALNHRIGVIYRQELTEWFEPMSQGEGEPVRYDESAIGLAMLSGSSAMRQST